jgi:hypothetical protein
LKDVFKQEAEGLKNPFGYKNDIFGLIGRLVYQHGYIFI